MKAPKGFPDLPGQHRQLTHTGQCTQPAYFWGTVVGSVPEIVAASRNWVVPGYCYLELEAPPSGPVGRSGVRCGVPLPTLGQSSSARIPVGKFGTGPWGDHCAVRSRCSLGSSGGLLGTS